VTPSVDTTASTPATSGFHRGRILHIGLRDRQSWPGKQELARTPGHRHDVVARIERQRGCQAPGLTVRAKYHEFHNTLQIDHCY
jgi:hypothetical protein